MLKYEIIRDTLAELLKIPDGEHLPSGSGVCLEVGKATKPSPKSHAITPEYSWVSSQAQSFGTHGAYVCNYGFMTPRRREFILYLLKVIEKEMENNHD